MILINNVSKTVASGSEKLTILHAVYLTIPRGQFVAVVGPSGSGKSTLLSLVAGLDYPTTLSCSSNSTANMARHSCLSHTITHWPIKPIA